MYHIVFCQNFAVIPKVVLGHLYNSYVIFSNDNLQFYFFTIAFS